MKLKTIPAKYNNGLLTWNNREKCRTMSVEMRTVCKNPDYINPFRQNVNIQIREKHSFCITK
jgi:hypothetical protein